jgi:hypothetical protein
MGFIEGDRFDVEQVHRFRLHPETVSGRWMGSR